MSTILILRRQTDDSEARPKPSKAEVAVAEMTLDLKARVRRPAVRAFFTAPAGRVSDFYKMGAVDSDKVTTADIILGSMPFWTVPAEDDNLGRKGEATFEQSESLRLWIKQNLSTWVNPSDVVIVHLSDQEEDYLRAMR